MNKNNFIILVVCLLGYLVLYSFQDHAQKQAEVENIKASKNVLMPIKDVIKTVVSNATSNKATSPGEPLTKEFMDWFETEANHLENSVQNPEDIEKSLKEKAKLLSSEQIDYLAKQSTDKQSSASSRIFASYLLSLGGANTIDTLVSLASKTYEQPAEPHTIDEMAQSESKANAIMAIDGIVKSETDLMTRIEKLKLVVSQTSDPSVSDYATKKLQELENLN